MRKPGFSKVERSYVARVAASKDGNFSRLGFYSTALVPAMGFGAYGLISSDSTALALAFIGLLFFTLSRITAEIKHTPMYFSIFAKIDAFERAGDA